MRNANLALLCFVGTFICGAQPASRAADLLITERTKSGPAATEIIVRFVTTRNSTRAMSIPDQFGSERGGPHYGKVAVSLKVDHSRMPVVADVRSIRHLHEREFFDLTKHATADRKVALFVHGFNVSFADALVAAARLKNATGPQAPMYVHSWPSAAGLGGLFAYYRDIAEVDYATPILRHTITNLLFSPEVGGLHVFGHSLGARPIVSALKQIFDSSDRQLLLKLDQVVFAAPDVEQEIMDRDYLPVVEYAGANTLVYVSSRDFAMKVSEFFSGRARVGSTHKAVYVRNGVTTIDISEVDLSTWGHSPFDSPRVAADLYYALNRRLTPKERHGLRPNSTYFGTYWSLRP